MFCILRLLPAIAWGCLVPGCFVGINADLMKGGDASAPADASTNPDAAEAAVPKDASAENDGSSVPDGTKPEGATGDGPSEADQAGSCSDGFANGGESDVDCGGSCPQCAQGKHCKAATDCASGFCVDGFCCATACTATCMACSEAKTGAESGACAAVMAATDPDQECSGTYVCGAGACENCVDGVKNGDEAAIDCGGGCPACGTENCGNGGDDDGDNLTDCADPDCSAFACVSTAPVGWQGPVVLWTGTGAPPGCSPVWTKSEQGNAGALAASPASCAACACAGPSGSTCGKPLVELYDPTTCTGTPTLSVTPPAAGTCFTFDDDVQYDGARCSTIPATGGSCAASGGAASVTPWSWEQHAQICSGTPLGQGCTQGVCAPRPDAQQRLCIQTDGDQACPPGAYSSKAVVYSGAVDSRGCSACTCGAASGGTCAGQVVVYGNAGCSTAPNTLPATGACVQLVGATYFTSAKLTLTGTPSGGSCTPAGGKATGEVTPTGATTLCCVP